MPCAICNSMEFMFRADQARAQRPCLINRSNAHQGAGHERKRADQTRKLEVEAARRAKSLATRCVSFNSFRVARVNADLRW